MTLNIITPALETLTRGLTPGLPDGTPDAVVTADMEVCAGRSCPACGRKGLGFKPHARDGRYVGFAVCENCGHGEKLPKRVMPRQRKPADPLAVNDPTADRLLTACAVARLLSIAMRTLWRLVEAGQFPEPVRFNRKLVRWPASAVAAYLEMVATRGAPAALPRKLSTLQVTRRLGVTREELDALVERNVLPAPDRRTQVLLQWSESDVESLAAAWLERKVTA